MKEVFKDVVGFNGDYQLSNYGDVITLKGGKRKKRKLSTDGVYKHIDLWKDGKQYQKKVHKLVAEAFIENPENKKEVNHIDHNPLNNNVDNLEWCSPKENTQHSIKHKRFYRQKITWEQVRCLREEFKTGKYNKKELIKKYKLSRRHISRILKNERWVE